MSAGQASACLDHDTLFDHVEGRLTAERTSAVLSHLDACSSCRELVAETVLASSDRPRPEAATLPSRTLDRYLLLRAVGSGAMGVVYAAYDPMLDRKVALKLLRAELSQEDLRTRLLREAQAMARLNHPNVLSVYDVGTYGGRVFIAMELIDGTTLSAWLKERKRPWREVLEVMVFAGRGLAAAHRTSLIHRDFKPDNVLVSREGRVCVTDFGLARLSGAEVTTTAGDPTAEMSPLDATLTRSGALIGTPAYMAPEQIKGEPASASADVFSFCVTLHQALFGVRPFAGNTLFELERAIDAGQIVESDAAVPGWLRRVVKKGLKADPAQRYPSMTELLAEAERGLGVRRRRWWGLAGAAVLAAGVAVALVPRTQAEVCRGAERKLAGVWDDPLRHSVAATFTAANLRGQEFAGALDGYTRDWVATRTAACEATRHGEQSQELLDLRMACLDDRLREVHALVDLVSRGTPQALAGSTRAALSLPALADCGNTVVLRAETAPPPDRARVEEVRRKLAEADQLLNTGVYPAGIEAANAAVEGARAIDYKVALAEGFYILGVLQTRAGKYEPARESLQAALVAAESAHSDRMLARSAMALAYLGYALGRYDEGLIWNRLTEAAIQRLGGNDALEADRLRVEATLHTGTTKPALARTLAEKSLALTERLYGRDDLRSGQLHQILGSVAVLQERYDDAIAHDSRAREIYVQKLGPKSDLVGMVLRSLAGAYYYQQRYEEALALEKESLALVEARLGPDHLDVGETLSNLGMDLVRLGRYREALTMLERARRIYDKELPADSKTAPTPIATTGEAYAGLKEWKPAIEWLERAVAHPDWTLADAGVEAVATRIALADALWETGRRPRALELAKKTSEECTQKELKCTELASWIQRHER